MSPRGALAATVCAALVACRSGVHDDAPVQRACATERICEIGSASRTVLPRDRAAAVAGGLLEICEGRLPPSFEGALRAYNSGELTEATSPGMVASLDTVVDASRCETDTRRLLEEGYGQLRRNVSHWVGANLRVPSMSGHFDVGARDVELVIPYRGMVTYRGEKFPRVENAVVSQFVDLDDRVVAVVDEDVPWGMVVDQLEIASTFGAREFGVLVATGDDYGVLALDSPTRKRTEAIVVVVAGDGFSFGLPVANTTDRPRVPLRRPGASLDDFERWDFDALDREIVRRVGEATEGGTAPDALVMFEPRLSMKVVIATAERIRGADCNTAHIETCRVRRLSWDAGWQGW